MPTTRSSAKKAARRASENALADVAAAEASSTSSPRYQTRSLARSQSDSGVPSSSLRFPFFDDECNTSTTESRNYDKFMSPGKPNNRSALYSSGWETELSPIAKSPDSEASHELLDFPPLEASPLSQSGGAGRDAEGRGTIVDGGVFTPNKATEATEPSASPSREVEEEDTRASMIPDLSSARKQLGQSSYEFIERIRNAAHKRKVAMTRSRDSLAAKEEELLRSIAESKNKPQVLEASKNSSGAPKPSKNRDDSSATGPEPKTFKARPLPPTTGALGSGGLEGVPKVEKRPTTTPFSPLLGARRPQIPKIKALEVPKPIKPVKPTPKEAPAPAPATKVVEKKSSDFVRPFKAREVPLAVRSAGNGGQYGVPKVPKRPVTVAMSPLLGPRRRSRSAEVKSSNDVAAMQSQQKRTPKLPIHFTNMTRSSGNSVRTSSSTVNSLPLSSDSPLAGLDFITTPTSTQTGNEENVTPTANRFQAYEPHSTRRAKKRAEFETRRKTMFQLRTEKEMQEREESIRTMQRELNRLRYEI